jgi:hypothetical protein
VKIEATAASFSGLSVVRDRGSALAAFCVHDE